LAPLGTGGGFGKCEKSSVSGNSTDRFAPHWLQKSAEAGFSQPHSLQSSRVCVSDSTLTPVSKLKEDDPVAVELGGGLLIDHTVTR
jgi:hypothetical protein